jgi:hypothetical protein
MLYCKYFRFAVSMLIAWMCVSIATLVAPTVTACSFNTCNTSCTLHSSYGRLDLCIANTALYRQGIPHPGAGGGTAALVGPDIDYDVYETCCVRCLGSVPIWQTQSTTPYSDYRNSNTQREGRCDNS